MVGRGEMHELGARHSIEEAFHDTKAREGVDDFYRYGALDLADAFLWKSLGDVEGKQLLEIGCGDGGATVKFARAGARVTAIDISGEMVELTRSVVSAAGFAERVTARRLGGEDLDYPEGTFDVIYGHSVLHHLNLDLAHERLCRVLKPGGRAVFLEPLDYNPILNLFRRFTPGRRTPTEKPLTLPQLGELALGFSHWEHHEFYLLSLGAFIWYYGIRSRTLFQFWLRTVSMIDRVIFRLVPGVRKYAWVTVVRYVK